MFVSNRGTNVEAGRQRFRKEHEVKGSNTQSEEKVDEGKEEEKRKN